MRYAVLNEKNKCIAITDFSSGEVNCLPLSENAKSENYLGKIYNSDSEKWEEDLPLERIEEMLKEQESSILDTAVNAEYLICLADLGL